MDIFELNGITDADGNPMSEDNVNPLMGYQIVHEITGRHLPQTQSYEIMGADYAMRVFAKVWFFYEGSDYEIDLSEYMYEPVYLHELDESQTGFILLYSEKDERTMGLFN